MIPFLPSVNLGKVVLRNLFNGFLKEELRLHSPRRHNSRDSAASATSPGSPTAPPPPPPKLRRVSNPGSIEFEAHGTSTRLRSGSSPRTPNIATSSLVVTSQSAVPTIAISSPHQGNVRSSPLITPMIPLHLLGETMPAIPQSPGNIFDDGITPSATDTSKPVRRLRSGTLDSVQQLPPTADSAGDYFSRSRQTLNNPTTPVDEPTTAKDPVSPGGFMGRLKNLTKKSTASNPLNKLAEPLATPTTATADEANEEVCA